MRSLCAWCGKEIKNTEVDPHLISHGICDECKSNLEFQHGGPLEKYLETLEAPILVVDGDGDVQMANERALKLLGKKAQQVRGLRGGVVFECAYSRLEGGCGNTIHCSGCTVRNTVMGTMKTGVAVSKFPAFLNQGTINHTTGIDLLISTIKSGKFVLLKIDSMKPKDK